MSSALDIERDIYNTAHCSKFFIGGDGMPKQYTYCDGLRRGRKPDLFFVKKDVYVKFAGKSIQGFCEIVSIEDKCYPNWSYSRFELSLPEDVLPLFVIKPQEYFWGYKYGSWQKAATIIDVELTILKSIIKECLPQDAKMLDMLSGDDSSSRLQPGKRIPEWLFINSCY